MKVSCKYCEDLEQVYQKYPESLVRLSRVDARSQSYLVKHLGGILQTLHDMTFGEVYLEFFVEMYARVRSLGQDGLVAQWLYSHIEEMERRYGLFLLMLERHEAYTSMLQLQDSLKKCLRTLR